jgi:hypothetical protein
MKQTAVEFVTYELALRMKQLGFDEPCLKNWDSGLLIVCDYATTHLKAPLYQQAFRWFREKHKLNGEVNYLPNVEKYGIITSDMAGMKPKDLSKKENFERGKKVTNNFVKYDTYEEAELACLEKLIEIVEQINS